MFGVQNVSPNMFGTFRRGRKKERKKKEEKRKKKKEWGVGGGGGGGGMTVLIFQSLRREFVDLWVAQPCLWVPE